jgi:tetratricopeptide (TPR) repeat protein
MKIDLGETLLTETLWSLHRRQWSGVVAVSSGDLTKGLFLRRGRFVFAASTVEEEKLGEFLVRTGRITPQQLEAALEAAQAGKRLGQALVEIGAVNDLDLEGLVAEQIHVIALSTFRWTHGSVRTEDVEEPIPADLALPLSTERLLLEGARTYPDARRLELALGDPARFVQLTETARPAFKYREVSESKAEKAVLAALRAPKTIGDLLNLPSARPALVRATYALLMGGLLEDATSIRPAAAGTTAGAGALPARSPAPSATPPLAAPSPDAAPMITRPSSMATPPSGLQAPAPPAPAARFATSPEEPAPTPEGPFEEPIARGVPFDVEKRARSLLDRGEREQALALLREEAERNPEARRCRRLLAMLEAYHAPSLSPAIENLILGLLEEDASDTELRYRLALCYKKAGIAVQAILQLKLVLGTDPAHAAAWRDLAELEASESGGTKSRPR